MPQWVDKSHALNRLRPLACQASGEVSEGHRLTTLGLNFDHLNPAVTASNLAEFIHESCTFGPRLGRLSSPELNADTADERRAAGPRFEPMDLGQSQL